MKFLEIESFQALTALLSSVSCLEQTLHVQLEAYSCKRAGGDKKLYRSLDRTLEKQFSDQVNHEQHQQPHHQRRDSDDQDMDSQQSSTYPSLAFSLSPSSSDSRLSISPFGSLVDSSSRHTFISLISTLNASFPDYDFSSLKPQEFTKEHLPHISTSINNLLLRSLPNGLGQEVIARFWFSMDAEISLKETDIYSYIPEPDSNPFVEDGTSLLWMYNYFFYNKKLKRMVFFHLRAVRNHGLNNFESPYGEDDDDDLDEMFDE